MTLLFIIPCIITFCSYCYFLCFRVYYIKCLVEVVDCSTFWFATLSSACNKKMKTKFYVCLQLWICRQNICKVIKYLLCNPKCRWRWLDSLAFLWAYIPGIYANRSRIVDGGKTFVNSSFVLTFLSEYLRGRGLCAPKGKFILHILIISKWYCHWRFYNTKINLIYFIIV